MENAKVKRKIQLLIPEILKEIISLKKKLGEEGGNMQG